MTVDGVTKNRIKKGDHVLVVGLGKSGLSAVKFMLQVGAKVSISEGGRLDRLGRETRRWLEEERVFVEEGGHTSELFCSVDHILLSPGVPLDLPAILAAKASGIPVFGEMALVPQFMKTPLVAVTGTNGKSTVVTLLGDLFRAAGKKVFVGGNIGTPLTDYLAGEQDDDVAVLEVSSFQIDGAPGFKPQVGILLNITPDHLDRYDSFAGYAESKLRLFAGQGDEDAAILNGDDPEIMARLEKVPHGRVYLFGNDLVGRNGARVTGNGIELTGFGDPEHYDFSGTVLAESPNCENGAAAIIAARLMGCDSESIRSGLTTFSPLAHRLTLVAEIDGVRYLDDSKATNIGAVKSALAGMTTPVVLIAGGRDKGGDYGLMADAVRQKVKALLLIGEARDKMATAFAGMTQIEMVDAMESAVARAHQLAVSGDTVLLSPACASFDMFNSYAHRGEVFKEAALKLVKGEVSPQAKSGLRIIVTGGGTGGHLFPGIAVADAVLDRYKDGEVLFVSTERFIDQKALANRSFQVTSIRSRGLKGKGLFGKLGGLLQVPLSLLAAMRLIRRFKPDIVFGVGGYVTGPVVLAARMLGVATAIHEQNSVPGLANRILGRVVDRVLLSIPGSEKHFPAEKCKLSGNPVRSRLLEDGAKAAKSGELSNTLLVLGGSQGAHRVNELVVEAVERAAKNLPSDFNVIHQTGAADEEWIRQKYEEIGVKAQVAAFFDDMAKLYNAAGLVVSRAGATSLAEMSVFGRPSILVPYPFAADDHQYGNARYLADAGGAKLYRENQLSGEGLAKDLDLLFNSPEERLRMGSMARKLSLPQATETIVDELAYLAAGNG